MIIPGVWKEWIVLQKVCSIQSNDCQSHPLPVHDRESEEAQYLAVFWDEGKPVVEISQSMMGDHNDTEQRVKCTQVYQQDVREII